MVKESKPASNPDEDDLQLFKETRDSLVDRLTDPATTDDVTEFIHDNASLLVDAIDDLEEKQRQKEQPKPPEAEQLIFDTMREGSTLPPSEE